MAKTKAASENSHGNKMMFCTETSYLFAASTICVAGLKFLKFSLITDDPIFFEALVTVLTSQNTEAKTLKVSANINHFITNPRHVLRPERYIEDQTP